MDVDVFREAHGLQHLWAEHATVADLDPLLQLWVEGEDLQRGLHDAREIRAESRLPMMVAGRARTSVYGLYAGLKRMFSMPIFLKKTRMKPVKAGVRTPTSRTAAQHADTQRRTDEVRQSQPSVCDDALNLVELSEMRRVHSLVPEHPVDREELRWPEAVRARLARAGDRRARVRALALDSRLGVSVLAAAARSELPEHGRR